MLKVKLNGSILISLGVGILISAILMNISLRNKFSTDVETEARKLGMVYPAEIRTIEVKQ